MDKPQPKKQLVVKRPSMGQRQLLIYCSDLFVSTWVNKECADFGYFGLAGTAGRVILNVSPLYDIDEVIAFVEACPLIESGSK